MDELLSMEDSGSDSLIPLSPSQPTERLLDDFELANVGTNSPDEATSAYRSGVNHGADAGTPGNGTSGASSHEYRRKATGIGGKGVGPAITGKGNVTGAGAAAKPKLTTSKSMGVVRKNTLGASVTSTPSPRLPSPKPASPNPRAFLRSSSLAATARRMSLGGHETGRTITNGNAAHPVFKASSAAGIKSNTSGTSARNQEANIASEARVSAPSRTGTLSSASSKSTGKPLESRRASLSGLGSLSARHSLSSSELKKWALSPTKTAAAKPSTEKPNNILQSPKVAVKSGVDPPKRSTPPSANTGTLKSVAKSAASIKSPASSTPATVKSFSGNGNATITPPSRNKLSPSLPVNRRSSLAGSELNNIGSKVSMSNGEKERVSGKTPPQPLAADRGPSMLTRRKSLTSEVRDSRFLALPSVDVKAGDDVRLDLRGQKVRTIDCKLVNLTPKLEFVYLRDNKLSSLDGIEILRRVKVLDLSFNEFKGGGFEPLANCKALQQLYLAGNQITSLSGLPQLPNLEFLSVAQNKIKSLSMATQPRLQVLAASKNKVATLKGFPCLPALEHLRLEENAILDTPHVEAASILLVGPTLKKFNDRDLSSEEQAVAQMYPASTALCLRNGWELCGPEEAFDSTLQFLSAEWSNSMPLGYKVVRAEIDHPQEAEPCCCEFVFEKKDEVLEDTELILQYQWFLGGKTPTDFALIDGATGQEYWPKHEDIGNCLKVECTILSGDVKYPPIFAVSFPISPGTGIPKVLSVDVYGEPLEGSVLKGSATVAWCGGTCSKGNVRWLRFWEDENPVDIFGAEEDTYQLCLEDVGANLIFLYTPVSEEGVKGEPREAITGIIEAAPPSVNNVQIVGDPVEGNILQGCGRYFGGREGSSKFEWLREDLESGQFKLVARGTMEYKLTGEDVGLRMMFIYTPVNSSGCHGDPVSAISSKVLLAPPMVSHLRIVGDLMEGNKVAISCSFSGGVEGASRVQWFKTYSPSLPSDEADMEGISSSKVAKAFRIPLGAVGHYLVAKYTPVRSDGENGLPVFLVSDTTVRMLPPGLNFLNITGEYVQGKTLAAQYGYLGGYEGSSQYSWYLHQNESDPGTAIATAEGRLEYEITKEAVGKYVSFRCTPARDDGLMGDSRSTFGQERIRPGPPKLTSLQIFGTPIEGEELHVQKEYWGGDEGSSKLQWYLTRPDGTQREIKAGTGRSYIVRSEDIDGLLCISCEPVRSDGVRGPIAISPVVGPVTPSPPSLEALEICGHLVEGGMLSFKMVYKGGEKGTCEHQWLRQYPDGRESRTLNNSENLVLTPEDVGCRIRLIFTPIRSDGVAGEPKAVISDVIVDGDPEGKELVIPDCLEDVEVVPKKVYFGGKEGLGEYNWFNTVSKSEIAHLPHDAEFLSNSMVYTPNLGDVGKFLVLRWVPVRTDGKRGKPVYACSRLPVAPACPAVHDVCVKEVSLGMYVGEGDYYGGYEGNSKLSWYRQTAEGKQSLIVGATSKTYVVSDDDYTARVIFGYTPVRSDGVMGKLVLSKASAIIFPELPRIQKLVISGKAVEGEILTAVEVMPKGESQKASWEKFKKEIKYSWSRSQSEKVDPDMFESIPLQRACTYKVRLEDVGYCMRCECIIVDIYGRVAEPVSCVTPSVTPGLPRVDKLEVEGRGYHTSLYAVRGMYFGGKEGNSTLQWFRAMAGSPDLIPISGEVGRMYEANVDDVGYRLVAVYTPVREDGAEGSPTSASTEPISVEPEVAKDVKLKLELGKVNFEALRDRDRSPMKQHQQQGLGSLERRILNVNTKRVKVTRPGGKASFGTTEFRGTYAPPFHVEVFHNDPHRVKIVIDSENEVDLMVQSRHLRDVIVLVVRGLAQKFNSTTLNLLLKL